VLYKLLYCSTEAMDDLAERLEGSGNFNIDVVITPLKDLISEAIMAYHENSKPVRDKVCEGITAVSLMTDL